MTEPSEVPFINSSGAFTKEEQFCEYPSEYYLGSQNPQSQLTVKYAHVALTSNKRD